MDRKTRGEAMTQVGLLILIAVLLGCLLNQMLYCNRADARFLPATPTPEYTALASADGGH